MSWRWYPCGVYGVNLKNLMPEHVHKDMLAAYRAVYHNDDSELRDDAGNLLPRFASLLEKHRLGDFEGEPGEFVSLAFGAELRGVVPEYSKVKRFASLWYVDSDGDSCDWCEPEDLLFGVSMYQFPLERSHSRAKLPKAFMDKATMMTWVVGG
jgi:hypothetical protein